MKDVKELLEMVIGRLNGMDVYDMEVTDPGCDCCSSYAMLDHMDKLGNMKNVYDEVIKADDVKYLKTTLEKVLAELK